MAGERLTYVWTRFAGVPRMRAFWWYVVRGYRYEMCQSCGRPNARGEGAEPRSWWAAPDAIWLEVVGSAEGIRCKPCFSRECDERGIPIRWEAVGE